ncbi:MAG: hypothetical protein ACSNEK_08225 [Parachlamydiaceae bacterium]
MAINLNFGNFFRYFAFHPNSELLSKKDRKTAKLATTLFAFSILGHLVCRLFLYRRITLSPTGPAVKNTAEKVDSVRKGKGTHQAERPAVNAPSKKKPKDHSKAKSTNVKNFPHASIGGASATQARRTCRWLLKELITAPVGGALPSLKDLHMPENHDVFQEVDFLDGLVTEKEDYGRRVRLNRCSLMDWPYLASDRIGNVCYVRATEADRNLARLDQRIDARVAVWEKALQLSDRIRALDDRNHLKYLSIEDLRLGPEQSAIPYAICSKEDLTNLSLAGLKLSRRHIEMIRHRMPTLDPSADTADFTLGKLISLSGDHLTFDLLKDLDASVLALLSDEQIKDLDFSHWQGNDAKGVFKALFNQETLARLNLLSSEQIEACWHLFDEEQLQLLPREVLLKINFKQCPLDRVTFDALFPVVRGGYPRNSSKIQYLSLEQVDQIWTWFTPEHASYLSDEQLQEISFDLFRKREKAYFHGALRHDDGQEGARRMALLTEDIRGCWDLIDEETISLLSKEQLKGLDKSTLFTKDLFNALFLTYDDFKLGKSWSRIKELSNEQIGMLLEHFSDGHLSYLTEKQVRELDFSKFSPNQFKAIFVNQDPQAYLKMRLLSDLQLQQCWHLMDKDTITLLSDAQIQCIDFKKLPLSKALFDALIHIFPFDNHPVRGSRARLLSPSQLNDCLHLFDEDQMRRLSEDQIKKLNFTQLKQEQFNGLFIDEEGDYSHKRIKVLDHQQIVDGWHLMTPETICLLTGEQIINLNFEALSLTQELFDSLVSMVPWANDPVAGSKTKFFTHDQLVKCLPFFRPEQMCRVSVKQIEDFKFDEGFTEKQFKGLFADGLGDYSYKRVHLLKFDQILAAWDLFDETIAGLLSEKQLEEIVSKRPLSKTMFQGAFPKGVPAYWRDHYRKKMKPLSVKHLQQHLKDGYFDAERICYLNKDQVLSLDFTIFNEIETAKELLAGLFSQDNPNQIELYRLLKPEQKEVVKTFLGDQVGR